MRILLTQPQWERCCICEQNANVGLDAAWAGIRSDLAKAIIRRPIRMKLMVDILNT